jgi:hypothetical protein
MLCAVERTMTWRSGPRAGRAEAPIACVQLEVCKTESYPTDTYSRISTAL